MSGTTVNCNAAFIYQVDIQVPATTTGNLATPTAGSLTGITMRLSLSPTGTAIDPNVGTLTATERSAIPGRFYVSLSQSLQQTYLLPLGRGSHYYAIWSNASGFDMDYTTYVVDDRKANG